MVVEAFDDAADDGEVAPPDPDGAPGEEALEEEALGREVLEEVVLDRGSVVVDR